MVPMGLHVRLPLATIEIQYKQHINNHLNPLAWKNGAFGYKVLNGRTMCITAV
jgi:hypothetical protein